VNLWQMTTVLDARRSAWASEVFAGALAWIPTHRTRPNIFPLARASRKPGGGVYGPTRGP
jgi:hypothetical protein